MDRENQIAPGAELERSGHSAALPAAGPLQPLGRLVEGATSCHGLMGAPRRVDGATQSPEIWVRTYRTN